MDTVWKKVIKIQKQEISEKEVCQLTSKEFLKKLENKIKKKRNCGKAESGIIVLDNDIQHTRKCKFHIPKFNPSDEVAVRRKKISDLVLRLDKKNDNATYLIVLFKPDNEYFKYYLWLNVILTLNYKARRDKFEILGLENPLLLFNIINDENTENSFKSDYIKTNEK